MERRFFEGYKQWAIDVKKRDEFKCRICNSSMSGKLVSHHIFSYKQYPELRQDVENGVCLCQDCHKKFHRKFGYGKNTLEQFERFIQEGKDVVFCSREEKNIKANKHSRGRES